MKSATPVVLLARSLDAGGIERDVSKFARYLSHHGFAPHVVVFRGGGMRYDEIVSAGVPVLDLELNSFRDSSNWRALRTLRDWMHRRQIALVHAFDVPSSIWAVLGHRRIGARRTISSQLCYRHLSPLSHRILLPVVDRLADAIFVNCEAVKQHLAHDWRVDPRRVFVCHNGVETAEFNAALRNGKQPGMPIVLGTVALLRQEKNLALLIRAFARVHAQYQETVLHIIGEGELRAELEALIRKLGIESACRLPGNTDQPAASLAAIDVFVLPSSSEAFSNALLEAMACGCCPIASDVGGTRELVQHARTGLLFRSHDEDELVGALLKVLADGALRKRLATAAASDTRERLNMNVAAERLSRIYRQVIEGERENA